MAVAAEVWTPTPVYHGRDAETIQIVEIALELIEMPKYQRDRKRVQIEKMAAEYDATAYYVPMVALFKERFIDLDGQQRLASLELRAVDRCTVALLEGVASAERLAEIFLHINRDRKLLNAFEKYIGAIGMKDHGSLTIQKTLTEFELEVSKSSSEKGKVPAGAVTKIYAQGGAVLLKRVFFVRQMAWAHTGAREANEGKTLLGLAQFLHRYADKIDDDRLIALLRERHPGFILGAIDKQRGVSQIKSFSDFLRDQYNKGLRGGARL